MTRLVETARDLFARDGFADTSLDDIVAACGVTKGSLYHHFPSKTALFEAVFEEECRRLADAVAAVVARKRDTWAAAYAGIGAFLDASSDRSTQRIMVLDAASVLGWDRMREIEAEYGLALVRATVEQLMAEGLIAKHDARVLSLLLFGALEEAAVCIARAADQQRTRRAVERELRALVGGLAVAGSSSA